MNSTDRLKEQFTLIFTESARSSFPNLEDETLAKMVSADRRLIDMDQALDKNDVSSFTYIVNHVLAKYEFVGPNCENIFGFPPQYFEENGFSAVANLVYPDDRPLMEEYWRRAILQFTKNKIDNPDWEILVLNYVRFLDKDGNIIWVRQQNAFLFFEEKTPVLDYGLVTQITDPEKQQLGFEFWAYTPKGKILLEQHLYKPVTIECPLTKRQLELLTAVRLGLTGAELANKLSITLSTLYTHQKAISKILNTKSVEASVLIALQNNWIK